MIGDPLAGVTFHPRLGFLVERANGSVCPVSRRWVLARCEAAGDTTDAAWRRVGDLVRASLRAQPPRGRTNAAGGEAEVAPAPSTRQRGA